MPATTMNHFTILTDDVEGTIRFYGDMLDLEPGPRPPFDFPGAWLYARGGNEAILHVIGGRPRDELRSGVIDHMAFTSVGLADTLAKLEARNMPYQCRRLVGVGTWQLFFHDVNGARVEMDFDKAEPQRHTAA
jgi:catechol 2,3-dioxygenase-like lactoylglutathione lyase family enzyme